jgi:hypothetical protein
MDILPFQGKSIGNLEKQIFHAGVGDTKRSL